MNNAIYRSGNLQNIISIDPLATQNAEVIFGPGSTIYGSDAIGGVMDFHSLPAKLNPADATKKLKANGNALARYSSANAEQTYHADLNLAGKKLAWMGSISYSSFNDLVMGKNGGQDSYLRHEYVQWMNNKDSIVKNNNSRRQVFSGFNQTNVVQKLRYKPTDGLELQYSFFYGGTSTAARYDRLIEYRNGALRFAEWNYGPMLWRMHHVQANLLKANAIYNEARITVAYQNYEESRIDRQRNNENRRTQKEKVEAWSANFDANKKYVDSKVNYLNKKDHSYKLTMNAPNDLEYEWLAELIDSPQVYFELDGYYYPVSIKNNNYEYSKYVNNRLRVFEVDIDINQTRYSQLR
jgi:hemoglobin/transferrin/lactoferrin receptor protein